MDDVLETVETPTEDASSAPEATTDEVQETPVSESADTEEKVSKAVPYDRFKEVNDELKSIKEMLAQQAPQEQTPQYQSPEVPDLDPDSARAVQHLANQVAEQREIAKFMAKHESELKADPLLDAAMRVEFEKASTKGGYVDREALLEQAKAAIDARFKPAQDAAKQQGIEEGRDIAKTKQQLSAVGETAKVVETDDSQLSAAELAKKYNIPRTTGY